MSVSDVCLTYLTFPQSYHTVMETVWHWAPLRPDNPPRERKRQLYMETLTYREVDNLNKEIKEMGAAQESLEKRMEEERKAAMEVR